MSNKKPNSTTNTIQSPTIAPPNIFADQPASLQVGPYVTKITLGVIEEDGNDYPRPVITIAMPTVNLIRMVNDLQDILSDSEFKKDSAKMLSSDVRKYFGTTGTAKTALNQSIVKRISKSDTSK